MKALIVEDEAYNLEHFRSLLTNNFPEVCIVGEAGNAVEAERLIQQKKPDVVFLDVQMPGESGLDLIMRLPAIEFALVFVTAFNEYALQAIRMSAIHYLIKPVLLEDLKEAIDRVSQRMLVNTQQTQVSMLIHQLQAMSRPNKLALPMGDQIRYMEIDDLMYCVCANQYTEFYFQQSAKPYIVSKGFYEFEKTLQAADFIRCHYSYMVNKDHVMSLYKGSGNWHLVMTNKFEVPVSRLRKELVRTNLPWWK